MKTVLPVESLFHFNNKKSLSKKDSSNSIEAYRLMIRHRNIFTRLTVKETFAQAFSIFLEQWKHFLLIYLISFVPIVAFHIRLLFLDWKDFRSVPALHLFLWEFVVVFVVSAFFWIFSNTAAAVATVEVYAGREPTFRIYLREALASFFPILTTGTLFATAVVALLVVGFIALHDKGLSTGVRFMVMGGSFFLAFQGFLPSLLTVPVVVLGTKHLDKALARCFDLTRGSRIYMTRTVVPLVLLAWMCQGGAMCLTLLSPGVKSYRYLGVLLFCFAYGFLLPYQAMYVVSILFRLDLSHSLLSRYSIIYSTNTVVYVRLRVDNDGITQASLKMELTGLDSPANRSRGTSTEFYGQEKREEDMDSGCAV